MTGYYKIVNIFLCTIVTKCKQFPWGLIRISSYFQKFLEYVVLYKHRLFCTLSYPEDASKINAKHVGFLIRSQKWSKNAIIGTIFQNLSRPGLVESTLYLIRLEQKILDISLNSKILQDHFLGSTVRYENRRNEIKNAKIYKTSPKRIFSSAYQQ